MTRRPNDHAGAGARAAVVLSPRRLSEQECWSQLNVHREGRLGYLSGRGPRHVVLAYAVVGDELVVRVPAYNEATQYAGGGAITFDVADRDAGHEAKRIEVLGRGRLAEPEDDVPDALPDEHWPADLPRRLLWLQVDSMHGETEPTDTPGPTRCSTSTAAGAC